MKNKILILDIETTGFKNQGGKIVEIGAVDLDVTTGEINTVFNSLCIEQGFGNNHIEKPFGWIFKNSDLSFGEVVNARSFEEVSGEFQKVISQYPLGATAFNNTFDFGFLEDRGLFFPKKLGCLMKLATPICRIPAKNRAGFKWPNAEEAFKHFFPDTEYKELHRGLDDAKHEAMVAFELIKLGKLTY